MALFILFIASSITARTRWDSIVLNFFCPGAKILSGSSLEGVMELSSTASLLADPFSLTLLGASILRFSLAPFASCTCTGNVNDNNEVAILCEILPVVMANCTHVQPICNFDDTVPSFHVQCAEVPRWTSSLEKAYLEVHTAVSRMNLTSLTESLLLRTIYSSDSTANW